MKKKKNAFTLLELVTIIAIIGILVALTAPKYWSSVQSAHNSTIEANVRNLVFGISSEYFNEGIHPTVDQLQSVIDSMNLNHDGVKYSCELRDDMLIITYESDSAKYSGFMGSATEPTQPSDIGSNLNDGILLSTVYFAYAVPLNDL